MADIQWPPQLEPRRPSHFTGTPVDPWQNVVGKRVARLPTEVECCTPYTVVNMLAFLYIDLFCLWRGSLWTVTSATWLGLFITTKFCISLRRDPFLP